MKKGQVVAILEKERAAAAHSDALGKVSALRMTGARLQAEVLGRPFVIDPKLRSRLSGIGQCSKTSVFTASSELESTSCAVKNQSLIGSRKFE